MIRFSGVILMVGGGLFIWLSTAWTWNAITLNLTSPPGSEGMTNWPRIEPVAFVLSFGSPAVGIGVMVFWAGLRILARPALVGELEARSDPEALREPLVGRYFGYLLIAAGALNIALSGACAVFVTAQMMMHNPPDGLGLDPTLLSCVGIGLGIAFVRFGLKSIAVPRNRLKGPDASSSAQPRQ